MDEYINRKKTKRELSEWCISLHNPHLLSRDDTMFLLDNIPAADVVSVVHGRWVYHDDDGVVTCSECGNAESSEGRYCSYCGARMDGGKCH